MILILTGVSRYSVSSSRTFADIISYLVLAELLLLASVEIDTLALRRASGSSSIPTFRRLSAIAILSNSIWLILSLIGLALSYHSGGTVSYLKLFILGSFFSAAFRAFVFGSVFYDAQIKGLPLALLQPFVLVLPSIYGLTPSSLLGSTSEVVAVACGIIILVGIELYVASINSTQKVKGLRPLELLQAFLNAWVVQDAGKLEQMLDIVSKERIVRTDVLELDSGSSKHAMILVPGIHPGPFYPIGSSNLPGEIFLALHSENEIPLTVHSISDHDLNLPSKEEVSRYISSLKGQSLLDKGNTITIPIVKTKNKATVSGFAMDSTVIVAITQAPYGMEDFPVEVRNEITKYSSELGFKEILVIDTHNSQGAKPSEEEAADAIEAARRVLDELKTAKQFQFEVAFAHSSELDRKKSSSTDVRRDDIGPGGIGLFLFVPQGGDKFSLVIADANNARISLREKVIQEFEEKTMTKLLEICTSDTHVTAARSLGGKGYMTLGDSTSIEEITSVVIGLYEKANSRLLSASFSSFYIESKVKTAGGELLEEFSVLLDSTINVAKRGAILLAFLSVIQIVIVALV